MKTQQAVSFGVIVGGLLASAAANADPVSIPNTFSPGMPAVAAEVNDNFASVAAAINDNDERILALEAENAELKSFIEELRAVMSLQDDNQGNPAVVFSGVNVHVNNGLGATQSVNGLGNLVIGYDEPTKSTRGVCSDGAFSTEQDCRKAGETFASIHKSGSHTIVIGPEHNYSRSGGLVAGRQNTVNSTQSSVTGGRSNIARGTFSSVSGGSSNSAVGIFASIGGGVRNSAGGSATSISGGEDNNATGESASISGGDGNFAGGVASTVGGGSKVAVTEDEGWAAGDLRSSN